MSLGCCCCRSYTSAQYTNATLVADYADPPGADIYPYPRPHQVWTYPPCNGGTDQSCGGAGYPLCGPWPRSEIPSECSGDIINDNCYINAETNTTVSSCPPGHKVVQARKQWHGRLPFDVCIDDCDEVPVKYLQIAITSRWETGHGSSSIEIETGNLITYGILTVEITQTLTVDRFSGLVTQSGCSGDYTWTDYEWNGSSFDVVDSDEQLNQTSCPADAEYEAAYAIAQNIGACLRHDCNGFYGCPDSPSESMATALNENGATVSGLIETATHIAGTTTTTTTYPNASISYVRSIDVEISQPYYGTDAQMADPETDISVETDVREMLAEWFLTNSTQYPWRLDGYRGLGALLTYSESLGTPDIGFPDCGYTATGIDYFDGTLLGKPFDAGAGTDTCDKTFSWVHETWECCSDNAGCSTGCWQVKYYGASSGTDQTGVDATDAMISPMASGWTDNYYSGLMLPGSWLQWKDTGLINGGYSVLLAQKQCEGKVRFKSYSLFGPCGAFRHQMDTAVSSCVASLSGSDVVTDDDLDALGLTTSDKVVFYGGPNTGKIYAVAAISGTSITLGAEDTDARNVLDAFDDTILFDWTSNTWADVVPGTNGIIGKLRVWERSSVQFIPPAICGKVQVTGVAQDGGSVVLTVATKYTQVGDRIICVDGDLSDTVYADNSGAGFTLTAASDTELRYTGTADAGWVGRYIKSRVYLPGSATYQSAPLAKWLTDAPRRNMLWQEWPADNTTGTFDTTPVNTDDRASVGRVLGSTPNTDTDSTWNTENYPSATGYTMPTCPLPTNCGGSALVIPIQLCTHPLWLPPITCGDPITVCAPEVEAMSMTRLAEYVADGAPDLPDGCSFNIPTIPPEAGGLDCDSSQPIAHEGQMAPWIECVPP